MYYSLQPATYATLAPRIPEPNEPVPLQRYSFLLQGRNPLLNALSVVLPCFSHASSRSPVFHARHLRNASTSLFRHPAISDACGRREGALARIETSSVEDFHGLLPENRHRNPPMGSGLHSSLSLRLVTEALVRGVKEEEGLRMRALKGDFECMRLAQLSTVQRGCLP